MTTMDDDSLELTHCRSYRVLVVDDEFPVRNVVSQGLERDGFEVVEAPDGEAAWERVQKGNIDIVITDICMPRRSGTELLDNLSEAYPNLPVIMMTGVPSVEAAVECIKRGAADYLSKPFEISRLRRTVWAAVEMMQRGGGGMSMFGPGSRLAGYRIVRLLGEGSVGVVFLAEQTAGEQRDQCAVKILKLRDARNERRDRLLQRFMQEAEAISRIDHPNVIRFVEYGVAHDDSVPYLVMEYFPAPSLKKVMARMQADLDYASKAEIVRQVASGLQAVHEQNICHRDVKPGNIMIDLASMMVKISDFGIAQLPQSELTETAHLMGSPAYMAPESFRSARVDHLADQFSLGAVAYELLLGRRAFDGDTVQALAYQIPHEPPPAPRELDPSFPLRLQRILARMLRKNPKERYPNAGAVVADLEAFLGRGSGDAGFWDWVGTKVNGDWP